MEKKKLVVGVVALIAFGMIFAGIGYAATYTYKGTTEITENTIDGRYVTVDLGTDTAKYSKYLEGIYTLDTTTSIVDFGTQETPNKQVANTYSNLQKTVYVQNEQQEDVAQSKSVTVAKMFNINDSTKAVTIDKTNGKYVAGEVATVDINIKHSVDAPEIAPTVYLNLTQAANTALANVVNPYGMSLIFTYTIGETETVLDLSATDNTNGIPVPLVKEGQDKFYHQEVTLKAYVAYIEAPFTINLNEYKAFNLNNVKIGIEVGVKLP